MSVKITGIKIEDIVVPEASIERIKKFHWDECGVQFYEADYRAIYKIVAADILANPQGVIHGSSRPSEPV